MLHKYVGRDQNGKPRYGGSLEGIVGKIIEKQKDGGVLWQVVDEKKFGGVGATYLLHEDELEEVS